MHDALLCPLTLQVFRDPVMAEDGHSYERQAIISWLRQYNTSPLTSEPISIEGLRPNHTLKRLVDEFEQANRSKSYRFKLGVDVKLKRRQALFHTFGKSIYEAEWLKDDQNRPRIVLMKIDGARAQKEASFYVDLTRHPNIVRTFGLVDTAETNEEATAVTLLQEYAPEGNLYDVIQDMQLDENVLQIMFLQVVDAMIFLAYNGVIHGDLACRNVLVFRLDQNEPNRNIVKLTDFGISRHSKLYAPTNTSARTTINIIPTRYAAPEVLLNDLYSEKSDLYSMGVLMWEAYSRGKIPWSAISSDEDVKRRVTHGEILQKPNNCSSKMWSVIARCFALDTKTRPTFNDLRDSLIQMRTADLNIVQPKAIRDEVKELVQELKEQKDDGFLRIEIENLSMEECETIMNELKHNKRVFYLAISPKKISLECISRIIESLKMNTRIEWLEFSGNDTELLDNPYLTTQGAHHLSELIKSTKTLTNVFFYGKYYVNDAWAMVIANAMKFNQSIEYLIMDHGQIGDKGAQLVAEMLAVNQQLNTLSLLNNHITYVGAKALVNGLKNNITLRWLYVGQNQFVWDDEWQKIVLEHRRKGLSISFNGS